MHISNNHPPIKSQLLLPIISLFIFTLFTSSISATRIDKPAVLKDHWKDIDPITSTFGTSSIPVGFTREEVRPGNFPAECVSEAKGKCDMSDMRAFKVSYDDCAEPWIFCHCTKAEVDLDHTIDTFGRVPVKARAHVKNVMLWPASEKAAAYAWNHNIGIHYPKISLFTILHEVGHIIEHGLSNSAAYKAALAGDTCVLTPYSQTSEGEAVGEMSPFVWWQNVEPEKSKEAYEKWGMNCLENQWMLLVEKLGPLLVPGGECPERVNRNTEFVRIKRSEGRKRKEGAPGAGGDGGGTRKRGNDAPYKGAAMRQSILRAMAKRDERGVVGRRKR